MAGADAVYNAALAQCGALRVNGIEEMFDLCRAFTMLPPVKGKHLAIVTNSGGPGVLASDRAEDCGLDVSPPSDGLRSSLVESLPAFCSFGKYHDIEVEDDVTAYVQYENGATGVFIASTGELIESS